MANQEVDTVVVGAGIAGLAAAYYLCVENRQQSVLLIDCRQPLTYTSAQSGDNYRNWWPHRTMTAFTNDSIDELERLARASDDVFNMTRGGYVLATRQSDISNVLATIPGDIEIDVYDRQQAIRTAFPALARGTSHVIHIRRGGDFNGQQLGQYLLERFRMAGGTRLQGELVAIDVDSRYRLNVETAKGACRVTAELVVNAAGPFAGRIAGMLGVELPIQNIYQQKIVFEDHRRAIPRDMPFSIDLDAKQLYWSEEERTLLAEDAELNWLTEELPPGTHCRPEGGLRGRWVKLGWAYNKQPSATPHQDMANEPAIDDSFPEIVLRGAAAFIPALQPYIGTPPPRISHYGGYYTMTAENWPLIGPLDGKGAFVIGALSGFGSMAACAAGKLCAAHICGRPLPDYAADLSLERLTNSALLSELEASANKGLL